MKNHPIDRGFPSILYIVNNWPKTKHILKKYILSNQKKPDLFDLSLICLREIKVFKLGNFKKMIKKLSVQCSRNVYFNSYHDQHHFKTVLVLSCILAKQINLNNKDKILLIIIALTHDMNHQGRRIKTGIPYYQEDRSYQGLERVIFKKILRSSEIRRIKRIFRSTYFPIKPDKVKDNVEKIILDADILASLMFGAEVGMKLAGRLKYEIRYNDKTELLFTNFLNFLGGKCLYLDYSKKSC